MDSRSNKKHMCFERYVYMVKLTSFTELENPCFKWERLPTFNDLLGFVTRVKGSSGNKTLVTFHYTDWLRRVPIKAYFLHIMILSISLGSNGNVTFYIP